MGVKVIVLPECLWSSGAMRCCIANFPDSKLVSHSHGGENCVFTICVDLFSIFAPPPPSPPLLQPSSWLSVDQSCPAGPNNAATILSSQKGNVKTYFLWGNQEKNVANKNVLFIEVILIIFCHLVKGILISSLLALFTLRFWPLGKSLCFCIYWSRCEDVWICCSFYVAAKKCTNTASTANACNWDTVTIGHLGSTAPKKQQFDKT